MLPSFSMEKKAITWEPWGRFAAGERFGSLNSQTQNYIIFPFSSSHISLCLTLLIYIPTSKYIVVDIKYIAKVNLNVRGYLEQFYTFVTKLDLDYDIVLSRR